MHIPAGQLWWHTSAAVTCSRLSGAQTEAQDDPGGIFEPRGANLHVEGGWVVLCHCENTGAVRQGGNSPDSSKSMEINTWRAQHLSVGPTEHF